jgi:hypothetical protein
MESQQAHKFHPWLAFANAIRRSMFAQDAVKLIPLPDGCHELQFGSLAGRPEGYGTELAMMSRGRWNDWPRQGDSDSLLERCGKERRSNCLSRGSADYPDRPTATGLSMRTSERWLIREDAVVSFSDRTIICNACPSLSRP